MEIVFTQKNKASLAIKRRDWLFYYAPTEQKSWRIIRTIFGACRLRNISGSKSLRL